MMMYTLAALSAAIFAGQASASAVVNARSALTGLITRQTFDPSEIPAQCQSQCDDAVNALNTCTTVSCLCSSTVNQGLYTCLECVLALDPITSLLDSAQTSLDEYELSCQEAGVNVADLTLTLPAASATGSSAVTSSIEITFNSITATATATSPAQSTATAATAATTAAETEAGSTTESSSSSEETGSSNPLASKNGADGIVSGSRAAIMGAIGVVAAALAL